MSSCAFVIVPKRAAPEVARRSMALLRQINAQPVVVATLPEPPTPPEVGHATKMFAFSGGQRDDTGFGELQYRFTYHDWFDNNAGFLRGAQIEGLKHSPAQHRFRSAETGAAGCGETSAHWHRAVRL